VSAESSLLLFFLKLLEALEAIQMAMVGGLEELDVKLNNEVSTVLQLSAAAEIHGRSIPSRTPVLVQQTAAFMRSVVGCGTFCIALTFSLRAHQQIIGLCGPLLPRTTSETHAHA
jgi:hypothetical protein